MASARQTPSGSRRCNSARWIDGEENQAAETFKALIVALSYMSGQPSVAAESPSYWQIENGMTGKRQADCGLRIVGNPGWSWNIARGILSRGNLPQADPYRIVVPIIVYGISDPRYWPQLVIQIAPRIGGPVRKIDGSVFNSYVWQEGQQELTTPALGGDVAEIIVLVSKRTTAPVDIDVCIGQPRVDLLPKAGPEQRLVRPSVTRQRNLEPVAVRKRSVLGDAYFARLVADKETACNRSAKRVALSPGEDVRYRADLLEDAAFLLVRTGRTSFLGCSRQQIAALFNFLERAPTIDLPEAHVLRALSLADSWLYPMLSGVERKNIGSMAVTLIDRIRSAEVDGSGWWAGEYGSNYKHAFTSALGIACERFEFQGADECRQYTRRELRRSLEAMPPDGSSVEGVSYWNYSLVWMVGYLRVLPVDVRNSIAANSKFLKNATMFRLHMSVPGFVSVIPFGDTNQTEHNRAGTALRGLYALDKDPIAAELAALVTDARWPAVDFVWRDDAWEAPVPEVPVVESQDTFKFLSDQGMVVWRQSWSKADSELVFFKAGVSQGRHLRARGVVFGGHNHPDQGEILYYSLGQWVLADDGFAEAKMTSRHNTGVFNGKGQIGEGGMRFALNDVSPTSSASMVIRQLNQSGIDLVADLSSVYPASAALRTWSRRIVKKSIGPLQVLDEVEAVSNIDALFLFHSDHAVGIQGNSACAGSHWQFKVIDSTGSFPPATISGADSNKAFEVKLRLAPGKLAKTGIVISPVASGCISSTGTGNSNARIRKPHFRDVASARAHQR